MSKKIEKIEAFGIAIRRRRILLTRNEEGAWGLPKVELNGEENYGNSLGKRVGVNHHYCVVEDRRQKNKRIIGDVYFITPRHPVGEDSNDTRWFEYGEVHERDTSRISYQIIESLRKNRHL